ncbi:hypothetical protein SAMN05443549_101503 [Flavobacterium fluvii]|uniref:Uncharacterized protein n=1 Tax=Flavobacterium fluvii TaxID=468056 RepID=A0A1M5EVY3_9FLAO|nr:hypothetical protein [Flavobacterium fluvii]SHF83202.1 hypothetical protein SAMN05443549_101503 [Flavobacterium fluvii]
MNYILTGIELHPDLGFGITADSYYKSAEHLMTNHFEHYDATQQAEMPQNFLFRHCIELYLKSLIIIFHKKLEINYGSVDFNSDDPEVFIDGKWRKLYSSHFIDKLYEYWLNNLLLPNIQKLNELAPKGDWQEYKIITNLFKTISKYDQDSSYFRYPITKNSALDIEKNTMQKFKATDNLEGLIKEIQEKKGSKKGGLTMLVFDDEDNITEAFHKAESVLPEVRDALNEVASYFHGIHIMTRLTLCSGM